MITIILLLTIMQGQSTDFLRIPVFARPTAMGSAYTSISDDAATIFYNPAGLNISQTRVSYTEWLIDTRLGTIAGSYQVKNLFTFGAGLSYLSYGKLDYYDKNDMPGGSFSPYALSVVFTIAKSLFNNLAFGLSGKYYSEKIFFTRTDGWAVDFGIKYTWTIITLGGALRNFSSPKNSFGKDFGFSLCPLKNILINAEFSHHTKFIFRTGLEYQLNPVAFRLGLNDFKPSFGIGYTQNNLGFDYAAMVFSDLGIIHQFSLGLGIK